ncbi:MAG: Clp protease N-terminal domain-containing protein, partial [Pseudomonadota bacterium]
MDKLTHQLQNALADAQSLALGKDNNQIDSTHLLQALLNQQGGSSRPLLQRAGSNLDVLQQELRRLLDQLPVVAEVTGEVSVSADLNRVLNLSDRKAQKNGDSFLSSELVLQALLETGGPVAKALTVSGVTPQALEAAVQAVRGGDGVNTADAEESRQALER